MIKIDDLTENIYSIAISGHIMPDGDCAGSLLALYNYLTLNHPEIRVDMYLEKPSSRFGFLKGYDSIISSVPEDTQMTYDLMFCLDCSTLERLGLARQIFLRSRHTVCIDHHISNNGYADENYIFPDASSTCEVLYDLMAEDSLDRDTAECLYVGIVSDTGIFKYACTSPKTMRTAARLMEYGIDTNSVIDESFSSKTYVETRIFGHALEKSVLAFDGRVVYSVITDEDLKMFDATTQDLDGISSALRLIRDTVCAFFIYEKGENEYKVSFRSDEPFDVNRLAEKFGGGGHVRAAGCEVRGELETCLEAIMMQISEMEEDLYIERCD